ncbi:MAG: 17 kDa surface antigen [Chitinophagaceae bacterium]|nr:17 kDa surface antigen [Chitinophagaceae bacterium]
MKKLFGGLAVAAVMAVGCNSNTSSEAELQQAKQFAIDSMKAAEAKIAADALAAQQAAAASNTSTKTVIYKTEPAATTSTPAVQEKKGWSNKAKGAVIGGVVGAATGAAVSDKKGKGAIIGGVVGAAGGYGVGAILDNKKKKQ